MAVTPIEGGWSLSLAGDVASWPGYNISVKFIFIKKTAIGGTVTLKDGAGNVALVTESISANASKAIEFPLGWQVSGLEYDAASAGGATVSVLGTPVKSSSHLVAEAS